MINKYIFVIDTDSYAGNFEREMCAYITGQIGECEVGRYFQKIARKEINDKILEKFDDTIMQVMDDYGNNSFCSIWKTPNWKNIYNTDIAKFKHYIREAIEGRQVLDWATHICEDKIKELEDKIKELGKLEYNEYNSVAIFFSEKPDLELIIAMKERALNFAKAKRENCRHDFDKDFSLEIYGFRIICERITEDEEKV